MRRSICRAAVLVQCLAVLPSTQAADDALPLPPPECVREVREARFQEQSGDIEGAIAKLRFTAARFPAEILPIQELLRIHREHGLGVGETAHLQDTLVERLQDPAYPIAEGSIQFLIETVDDPHVLSSVAKRFETRLSNEDDLDHLTALATVQGKLGRDQEARATLGRAIAIESSYRLISRALYLDMEMQNWESALELLDSVQADQELGELWQYLRFQLLVRVGRIENLETELDRLQADSESEFLTSAGYQSLLTQAAWDLYDRGELELSERIWRQILRADSSDLESRRVVANLFSDEEERLEQTQRVDRQLEETLEPEELLAEGTNYLAAGDNDRAFILLHRAAPQLEDNEAAWFNLGIAADRLLRWETSVEAYRKALELNRTRPETHFHLATALRELGDCSESVTYMESGLKLDPNRTSVYYYLSGCYRELGRLEEAARAMSEYERRKD